MYIMEGMMKTQTLFPNTTSPPLSIHKDSKIISKVKPKIRIIHIFAPEIIKTDVANFRELVQRLTGKPSENNPSKKKPRRIQRREEPRALSNKKMEVRNGFCCSEFRERIKGEEEIWGGANSGGGFLGGFGDLDGFMQELSGFPLIPLDASHTDAFGLATSN